MCHGCAHRPEMRKCPQCKVPLLNNLSRVRVLEKLAAKILPPGEGEEEEIPPPVLQRTFTTALQAGGAARGHMPGLRLDDFGRMLAQLNRLNTEFIEQNSE